MRILVGYFSETGNTKRIAEAIGAAAEGLGHETRVAAVSEITAEDLAACEVAFLGSTCHSADVAQPLKATLSELPEGGGPKVAGFVTHATTMPDGDEWRNGMYEKWAGICEKTFTEKTASKGVDFLGYFHCQGAPSPQIEAFVHSTIITDEAVWKEYLSDVRGRPNDEDLEAAKRFAKQVLEKA